MTEVRRLRQMEIWIAWVRLLAIPFAFFEVAVAVDRYPHGYEFWAWTTAIALTAGSLALFWLARRNLERRARALTGLVALTFDFAVVYALVFVYAFQTGTPPSGVLYLPIVEAALRYGLRGGTITPFAAAPLLYLSEWWRAHEFGPPPFDLDNVSFRFGLHVLIGLVVGWLVDGLRRETALAETRAAEAEGLRDQLGRRADLLEAVNRAARALGSSLDQETAFDAFKREMRGIVAFDRLAVELREGEESAVVAEEGSVVHTEGLEHVIVPIAVGGDVLGTLDVVRAGRPFESEEIEMLSLLARQVAVAVENMRAYDAERSAAEELRRLSQLRADFVSMVSHELRAPMTAVIGCAQTLRTRWRELQPEQRESFIGLIESETSRLASLVGDVLDSSRLEEGTFPYTFGAVDVEVLVRETTAVVSLGQDDVTVTTSVQPRLPAVRGDRDRLRQVLINLLVNAVKYTVAGDEIEVIASQDDGLVAVSVRDHGPGIPTDQQVRIFEKFGRASPDGATPGAGLGLFIARSIAEAHGGSLDVDSTPGEGATFTLRIPVT